MERQCTPDCAGSFRSPSYWLLLAGSAASIGSIASVNFLMKFVFEEQGFTQQLARNQIWSTASSVSLVAAIVGRLTVGYLADRWSRKSLMLATYAIVAAVIPTLFLVRPEQPGFVYPFAIIFGFAMGADYMLIPLMAADLFGVRSLARAMSGIIPSDTIGQYWFPNLIAQLRRLLPRLLKLSDLLLELVDRLFECQSVGAACHLVSN